MLSTVISTAAFAGGAADERAYFVETVLGTEIGAGPRAVRKWVADPVIEVRGQPSAADMRTLFAVIADLNELVAPLELRSASDEATVVIHFAPEADFAKLLPEYRPPDPGFHWVSWNEYGEIYEATILIATTGVSQAERSHIIREELTQSLGLLMDSSRYPDSIFYRGWTTVDAFSDLDRKVIRLLYSPDIEPGTVPTWAR
ncbi:MAG: DUF2927 domain-containing protein [Gammaproteobacteria bacterium]|nr:DUF2927 domain-containing protein [Gammaproteobacteria bacterium]